MTDENQNDYSFLAEEQGRGGESGQGISNQTEVPVSNASSGVEAASGADFASREESISANEPSFAVEAASGADFASREESISAEKSAFPKAPPYENIPASVLLAQAPPSAQYVTAEKVRQKKKPGRANTFLRRFVSLIAAAALFGIVAAGAFIGFNELYYHLNPSARPSYNTGANGTSGNITTSLPPLISFTAVASGTSVATADVSSIVDTAMPSLVSISCTFRSTSSFFGYLYEGTTEGSGSGIIVGKNETELLIATNNHVVDDAITTTVTFLDGSQVDATVRGTEEAADLAIVSVLLADIPQETLAELTTAILGNSDEVKVGQMVIAIGNSLGYGQTTTVGYLSAKEREVTVTDSSTGKSVNYTALQVDAAINPGNSGGALLDTNGRVIGINSAKLSSTNVEGIGYAIPINDAIDILTELMNREILTEEERGYLGVYLSEQEITAEVARLYGFPRGVYIADVVEGGAAARAGILPGDIVTAINGSSVTLRTQLQEKVNSYRSGTEIEVTLARLENGAYVEHNVTVVLGSKADFD